MGLELHLFGRPRALAGGQPQELPFERRHQLIAYLALRRTWVGRGELAAMLWPGIPSRLALANLRKTLFRLQLLDWAPPVEAQTDALRFDADTDVARFELALREKRTADAVAFRAHDLLAGYDDGSEEWSAWLGFERERLRSAWRAAALAQLNTDIDATEATAITSRLLEADPTDEDAVRAHMDWLARAGQVGAARRAYLDFAARLQKDFGLAPGAQLREFHALLGEGATPAAAISRVRDESFIGRSHELQQIAQTLASGECRLLCIAGPGGAGKTRLARHVCEAFGARYPHGAAFVRLEALGAPAEVGMAIAQALDVAVPAGADPLARVIDALREREMLLVLDNFEHLTEAALQVHRLVESCVRLQVLVTSRVRLGLQMEWALPLQGFPVPGAEDSDRLDAFDATRLFLRTARRVNPDFAAGAEAQAIIAICGEVEGLPLAIELAATWTRFLSCEAIAKELREGTQLLRTQEEAWPARHGSMDVVFEHSWALLSPAERDALARLSVFRGGFSADAAMRVARASLPVLRALVDKSLLRKEGDRLTQHPLIQQLSVLRLPPAERGETEAAHADHFHRMLEQLQVPLELGERDALARVDAEFENCRAGWRWSTQHGDHQGIARSAAALRNYCDHRARLREARVMFEEALEAAPPPTLAARLRVDLARVQYRFGSHAEAIVTAEQALADLPARDRPLRLLALAVVGCAHLATSRHAAAEEAFRKGLALASAQDVRMSAVLLGNLAWVERQTGRFREAIDMSLRALEQFRAVSYTAAEAVCLSNIGELYLELAEPRTAKRYLDAALELADKHGFVATRMLALTNLADLHLRNRDLAAGRACARRALDIAQSSGQHAGECSARLQLARADLQQGDVKAAHAELQKAARLAVAAGEPALKIECCILYAELLARSGDVAGACAVLRLARAQDFAAPVHRARADGLLAAWGAADASGAPRLTFAELIEHVASQAQPGDGLLAERLRT